MASRVTTALVAISVLLIAYASPCREDIPITTGWKFNKGDVTGAHTIAFNDNGWEIINLPHTWNAFDGQDGGNNYYREIGWYRKHCTISNAYAGKKIFIQFDGANIVTDVYVNGVSLGTHFGGFARFRFDITPQVNFGADNVIAVKVNNSSNSAVCPKSADFTFFGGLYRGVSLLVTDVVHIQTLDYASAGVYLKQSKVSASSADLEITAKIINEAASSKSVTVKSTIVDAGDVVIKAVESNETLGANAKKDVVQTVTLSNPRLWNGVKDPYLYSVRVEIIEGIEIKDSVIQPLGLRFLTVDANQGLLLNGAYYALYGVCRHQDRLNKGWAVSFEEESEDFNLIKEIGARSLRTGHYQQSQYFMDLCDKQGIVVWTEVPVVNGANSGADFFNNAKDQLRELIRQNYNHPAIFFWGIGNESYGSPYEDELAPQLHALAHTEDPARLTNYADGRDGISPVTTIPDVIGYNKYFGWYGSTYANFAPWADKLHKENPALKLCISEYGVGASIHHHEANPPQPATTGRWHPEEYQNVWHEAYWKAIRARPFIWGSFIWNMFDFAVDNRSEGDELGRNDKGVVTFDRKTKKDIFYLYKAQWTEEPLTYISSRRFSQRADAKTDVKIYSNCQSVELFVNGVSQGSKTSADRIFQWTGIAIPLKDNMIKTIGKPTGASSSDSVVWGYFDGGGAPFSQGKPATASTSQTGNSPGNANDGQSSTTRWSASDASFPQWWNVDLGEKKEIGNVRIKWYAGTVHSQFQYKIEISDNENSGYSVVADRSANRVSGITSDDFMTNARYVRITTTGVIPSGVSASFYEVKVYAPDNTEISGSTNGNNRLFIKCLNNDNGLTIQYGFTGKYVLKVVDIKGRIVIQKKGLTPNRETLGRSLGKGTYIVNVVSDKGVHTEKIMLVK